MSCTTTTTTTTIPELTVDEKIGQLFAPDAYGVYMNETSWAYKRLDHFVREQHVGGFVWFSANVYETAMLNKRLQAASKIPLLISADLESGIGMRMADTTFWPPAMAVAATGDPSFAERQGRATAIEAKALGINHILAPVADVNVDPDNTVINTRSYGEDPKDVARYVAAFVRGVRGEGVLATAKHFPGHGDTHVDSHRSLPVLNVTRERLNEVELIPFRAAIDAGVDAVMIGHLAVPALDPTLAQARRDGVRENRYADVSEAPKNATLPATLSHTIIQDLLRKDLGFRGLVVTDAFDMGGLTDYFDAGEAAVRAIEAGEDQILMPSDADAAIAGVKAAVKSGRIPMSRIDESVKRILDAKSRVSHDVAGSEEIFRIVDSEESRDLANEIATKALTLVRLEQGALPLKKDARVLELVISDFNESSNPLAELDRDLRTRLSTAPQVVMLDAHSWDPKPAIEAAGNADVVLIALAVRVRSGAGQIAVPEVARQVIGQLASMNVRKIGVSFGTPYLLREVPSLPTYICAYGRQPVLQAAVSRALFGETKFTGHLPVTIPGFYQRGFGITQ
jgi:beta-glucosidase-like glycosyl hydrolase